MDILQTVLSFIVGLGVLITVHESGHFLVARYLGVKVLRFSIGFGKPIWRHKKDVDSPEYVIAAIPLGGYVKMLDEREGPVEESELHKAFNRQPLFTRFAVVLAGPMFNFIFAVIAYWFMFNLGTQGLIPNIKSVEPQSAAAEMGLHSGDRILAVNGKKALTWERVIQHAISESLNDTPVTFTVESRLGVQSQLQAPGGLFELDEIAQGSFFKLLGVLPERPVIPPRIGKIEANAAADIAGIKSGDLILEAESQEITSWTQWVEFIRARPAKSFPVRVDRNGVILSLTLKPARMTSDDGDYGRIGAGVEIPADREQGLYATEQYSIFESLSRAVDKTGEVSLLTLRMIWKMLKLEVSVKNLSGPISIAQYAGHSAAAGLSRFFEFLAIVSVSLGVLNLLPIPVLDGGHLMYYLIELLRRKPVSEATQLKGQQFGIAMLVALMSVAIFNDIARLLN